MGIDAEVPYTGIPIKRTVEIRCRTEGIPLPIVEDNLHVKIALTPIIRVQVIHGVDIHEVVKVDFIGCLILLLGEIEFVSHLVGKEQSLFASLFVSHGFYSRYC